MLLSIFMYYLKTVENKNPGVNKIMNAISFCLFYIFESTNTFLYVTIKGLNVNHCSIKLLLRSTVVIIIYLGKRIFYI